MLNSLATGASVGETAGAALGTTVSAGTSEGKIVGASRGPQSEHGGVQRQHKASLSGGCKGAIPGVRLVISCGLVSTKSEARKRYALSHDANAKVQDVRAQLCWLLLGSVLW